MNVRIRVDDRKMQRDLRRVKGPIARKAMFRALNHSARKVKTASTREISKRVNIKQAPIRKRLVLGKATRRNLKATVLALLLHLRAGDIGKPRQNARGVRVGKQQFDGAFITDLGAKKDAVMRRVGRQRLPIVHERVEIQGIAEPVLERAIATIGSTEYVKECERLLKLALRRTSRA